MKGFYKKFVSILAAICLLASIALPTGLLTTAADEIAAVVVAYVDSATTETTGELDNVAKPYATLSAAIAALDVYTGEADRVAKIVGSYSIPAKDNGVIAAHTNPITIKGASGTKDTIVLGKAYNAGGALTIDSITYAFENANAELALVGHGLTIGEEAV